MVRIAALLFLVAVCCMKPAELQAQTPKRGGTLNFAITAEPADYDCHASPTFALYQSVSPFYSFLVKYDSSQGGKITGDLAKSWTILSDGLEYAFKLHEGVTFHDGSPLTSADVKASFDRIKDPPPGVVSLRKSQFDDVEAIAAPDPVTVVFKLKTVNVSFFDTLAGPFNCIYSAAKLKEDPRFPVRNIFGSGAFQLVEHVKGSHMTGKRYDGYFRKGLPYLDGYKAFFVKGSAVVPGLIGGQFDAEFRGRNPAEKELLVKGPNPDRWVVQESPWLTFNILVFNVTAKPFDDPRVRRALSLAIDRWGGNEQLAKITVVKATGGFVRPGSEFALPDSELETFPGYWRDIEKSRAEARRLLKEAGHENLKFRLHNRNLAEPYTPIGVFLIDQWKRIGVTAEHSQVETGPFVDNLVTGKFEVALSPGSVPADDVTAKHQMLLTHERSPISYARHKDTKLDDLWAEQARTIDPAKRKALVHAFERHMLTENYSLSINWWHRVIVHHRKIKGWYMSASQFQGQDLVSVWIDE